MEPEVLDTEFQGFRLEELRKTLLLFAEFKKRYPKIKTLVIEGFSEDGTLFKGGVEVP